MGTTLLAVTDGSGTDKSIDASLNALNSDCLLMHRAPPQLWTVTHSPAVNTIASASKAAGGASVRLVCNAISFSVGSIGVPGTTSVTVNLRDGATGAGTVLCSWTVACPSSSGFHSVNLSGLGIIGTANTAMTLEFSAASTNTFQSCNLMGFSVK